MDGGRKYIILLFKAIGNYIISTKRDYAVIQAAKARKVIDALRLWRLNRYVPADELEPAVVQAKWNNQVNMYLANHKLTVRAFFKRFDRDGDGQLDIKEVRKTIETIRDLNMSLKEIKVLMKLWDSDRSGTVDYDEFVKNLKYEHRKMKVNNRNQSSRKIRKFSASSFDFTKANADVTGSKKATDNTLQPPRMLKRQDHTKPRVSGGSSIESDGDSRQSSRTTSRATSLRANASTSADRTADKTPTSNTLPARGQTGKASKSTQTHADVFPDTHTRVQMDESSDFAPISDISARPLAIIERHPADQELICDLEEQVDELRATVDALEEQIEEQEDEIAAQLVANADLDSRVLDLEEKVEEAHAEASTIAKLRNMRQRQLKQQHADAMEALQRELDELRVRLEADHARTAEAVQVQEEAQEDQERKDRELEQLREALAKLQEENAHLKTQQHNMAALLESKTAAQEQEHTRVHDLEQQLEALREQREQLQQHASDLQRDKFELEQNRTLPLDSISVAAPVSTSSVCVATEPLVHEHVSVQTEEITAPAGRSVSRELILDANLHPSTAAGLERTVAFEQASAMFADERNALQATVATLQEQLAAAASINTSAQQEIAEALHAEDMSRAAPSSPAACTASEYETLQGELSASEKEKQRLENDVKSVTLQLEAALSMQEAYERDLDYVREERDALIIALEEEQHVQEDLRAALQHLEATLPKLPVADPPADVMSRGVNTEEHKVPEGLADEERRQLELIIYALEQRLQEQEQEQERQRTRWLKSMAARDAASAQSVRMPMKASSGRDVNAAGLRRMGVQRDIQIEVVDVEKPRPLSSSISDYDVRSAAAGTHAPVKEAWLRPQAHTNPKPQPLSTTLVRKLDIEVVDSHRNVAQGGQRTIVASQPYARKGVYAAIKSSR